MPASNAQQLWLHKHRAWNVQYKQCRNVVFTTCWNHRELCCPTIHHHTCPLSLSQVGLQFTVCDGVAEPLCVAVCVEWHNGRRVGCFAWQNEVQISSLTDDCVGLYLAYFNTKRQQIGSHFYVHFIIYCTQWYFSHILSFRVFCLQL